MKSKFLLVGVLFTAFGLPAWADGYQDCQSDGFSPSEWQEIPQDTLAAAQQCEASILAAAFPEVQRVLSQYQGVTTFNLQAAPVCTGVGGSLATQFQNISSTYDGKANATAGNASAVLDWSEFFLHQVELDNEVVYKGRIVSPLGQVIAPGVPWNVTHRKLHTTLSFQITNTDSGIVVLDSASFYQTILQEFGAAKVPVSEISILECDNDQLPDLESPVQP